MGSTCSTCFTCSTCLTCREFCSRRNGCLVWTFYAIISAFGLGLAVLAIMIIGKLFWNKFENRPPSNILGYWVVGMDVVGVVLLAILLIIGIVCLIQFIVEECRAARERARNIVSEDLEV